MKRPKIEDLDLIIASLVGAPILNESENAMLGLAKKAEALEKYCDYLEKELQLKRDAAEHLRRILYEEGILDNPNQP